MTKKLKRRGAGHLCLGLFHMTSGLAATIDQVRREYSEGLSENEWEFIDSHYKQVRKMAENFRKLGWRLLK
jgi:hypothetical protein